MGDLGKWTFEEVSSRLAVFRVSRNAVLRKSQAVWQFFWFSGIAWDGNFEEVSSRSAVFRVSAVREFKILNGGSGNPKAARRPPQRAPTALYRGPCA